MGSDDEMTAWLWDRTDARRREIAASDPAGAAHLLAAQEVIDLHDETEQSAGRHGHWEGHGVNERWIRDEPNVCPVDGEEAPCKTVRLLGVPFAQEAGYREEWVP